MRARAVHSVISNSSLVNPPKSLSSSQYRGGGLTSQPGEPPGDVRLITGEGKGAGAGGRCGTTKGGGHLRGSLRPDGIVAVDADSARPRVNDSGAITFHQ